MARLSCPECRLLLDSRWPAIAPEYCPRCLAKQNAAVRLVAVDRPERGRRLRRHEVKQPAGLG